MPWSISTAHDGVRGAEHLALPVQGAGVRGDAEARLRLSSFAPRLPAPGGPPNKKRRV